MIRNLELKTASCSSHPVVTLQTLSRRLSDLDICKDSHRVEESATREKEPQQEQPSGDGGCNCLK